MIRILVADDSATIRTLLVTILEASPEMRVVGQAADGEEAVRLTAELRPDVVTMDIHMPGLDGLEATKEIMAESPTPIIIVSSAVTEEAVGAALDATRAGALMALPTPSPHSDRFEEDAAHLRAMTRAMAGVKVLRRRGGAGQAARPKAKARDRAAIEVVAIAASTGGPAALHRLLLDLPRDFPVPILVVQHIARTFVGGLCTWLNGQCNLRVKIAGDGEHLQPRTVYLAPDEHHLGVVRRGVSLLSSTEPVGGFRPSGTFLFDSVAHGYGSSAVAIVLTGMGRDGAEGAKTVRAAGGIVLAQDEASSIVYGMPGEAVRVGAAEKVLPLERMGGALVELIKRGRDAVQHTGR